jgi:hypothetical protein
VEGDDVRLPDEPTLDTINERIARIARTMAREEIASMCGLVLRRLQEDVEACEDALMKRTPYGLLAHLFGELLRDYGATPDLPGPEEVPTEFQGGPE